MKVTFLKIRSFIFILLFLLGIGLTIPLHRKILSNAEDMVKGLSSKLYEKTGLYFSYESLSPSILSKIFIKNIIFYDSDDNIVFSVKKTSIDYNIFKLAGGNISDGIKSFVIDGIDLNLTEVLKIKNHFSSAKSSKKEFNLNELYEMIPKNVKLKNIHLNYESNALKTIISVKDFEFEPNSLKNAVNFEINSNTRLELPSLKKKMTFRSRFYGTLNQNLENSSLYIMLSDLNDGAYTIKRLNFFIAYSQKVLDMHLIQSETPFALGADYRFDSKDLNIQLRAQDFYPASVLNSNAYRKKLKKIKELMLNTDTIVKLNFEDKSIDYISDTDIHLPSAVIPGGADLSLSLFGDETQIELDKFHLEGQRVGLDMQLNYEYKNFKLSGGLTLPYFILANGKSISTELYIDSLEKGFMIFSPQLFIGDKSLSSLQLNFIPQKDSFYYDFEASDFSHAEAEEPGIIRLNGSFMPETRYVESNVSLQSLCAGSIADFAAELMNEAQSETLHNISQSLESIMFSGDMYLTSDSKSLSYNVPYIIAADTKKNNRFVMLSFSGNEQSLSLNRFSAIFGKMNLSASASFDMDRSEKNMIFLIDVTSGGIPYHFSGTLMKDYVYVSGDYNTEFSVNLLKNSAVSGYFTCENLPLVYNDITAVLTTRSNLSYSNEDGPEIRLNHFELEAAGANYKVMPKIALSGSITRYGAVFDSFGYSDMYSSLAGTANLAFDYNNGIFNSIGLNLNLNNSINEESVNLSINAANPEQASISKEMLINSLYFDLQMQLVNFNLNHFFVKNDNNHLSGSLFASGTVKHPYVSVNLDNLSMMQGGKVMTAQGVAILEDRDFSIQSLNISKGKMEISDITADFSLTDMTGTAKGNFLTYIIGKSLDVPFEITFTNPIIPEGKMLPDAFMINLSSNQIGGSFVKKPFPFSASLMYDNHNFNFFTSDNIGIYGYYTSDKILDVSYNNNKFAGFKIHGTTSDSNKHRDIHVSEINIDLAEAFSYFNFDFFFNYTNGIMTGNVDLTGSSLEPDLTGSLLIKNPEFIFNLITNQKLNAPYSRIELANNEIILIETPYFLKKTPKLTIAYSVFLNRLSFDHLDVFVKSLKGEKIPGKLDAGKFVVKSDIEADLTFLFEGGTLDVEGSITGEGTSFTTSMDKFMGAKPKKKIKNKGKQKKPQDQGMNLKIRTDLDIQLGNHATFILDPLLRAVLVPDSHLGVVVDTDDDIYAIDGDVGVRSGDISYLNRNFYIKNGRIKFNPDELLNPLVTLRAETRERDSKNRNIKISMNVERQYLQDLNPRFTSDPIKSENEIRNILGQIAIADSSNDNGLSATSFILAAGDYAIQSALGRKIENSLRELLNFDIFSVRTNVLQNTVNYSMARNSSASKEVFAIGNLLDNSTVYMGKYLNNSIYVDAMLHLSLDDTVKSYDELIASGSNLVFQPEFGMELESPFVNIRWSVAPDIKALMNQQYKPSSALTLSWKFSF